MRRTTTDICADCSAPGPGWASVNRGVMVCDECCSIHRSLGRHISHIRHIQRGRWAPLTLEMFRTLVSKGANSIWEHQLLDPAKAKNSTARKPTAKDKLHSTKEDFIRSKYKRVAFMNRLPVKEEDEQAIEDLSKQLHASVRTNNLETSLRLMALGAKVDYFHRERGNMALHVAASAGQALQCELLVEHGADPCALDSRGHTAVECARIAGYHEMADRLIDCQYELTDRLTFYVCGTQPVHVHGQHHMLPNFRSNVDMSENAVLARSKLHALSNVGFEELAADVYDEVDRRETEADWLQTQNHTSLVSGKNHVPFLPVNPSLSTVRNQGRQKLATFSAKDFSDLIVDILMDTKRRQMESIQSDHVDGRLVPIDGMEVINQQQYDQLRGVQARPSEVTYDDPAEQRGMPSKKHLLHDQHDYDEVTIEGGVTKIGGVIPHKRSPMSNHFGQDQTDHGTPESEVKRDTALSGDSERTLVQADTNHTESPDGGKSDNTDVLNGLRNDLASAEARIQQLLQVNGGMGEEIRLLQAMVQKLMQENSMLRTLQVNSPTNRSPVGTLVQYRQASTPSISSAGQRPSTPPPIPEKTVRSRKSVLASSMRAPPAQRSVSTSAVPSEFSLYSNSPNVQPKNPMAKPSVNVRNSSPKQHASTPGSGHSSPLLKPAVNHLGDGEGAKQAPERQNNGSPPPSKDKTSRPSKPPQVPPKTRRPRPQTSFEGSSPHLLDKARDNFTAGTANVSANGSSQTGASFQGVPAGGKKALVPTAKQLREAGRTKSAAPLIDREGSGSSLGNFSGSPSSHRAKAPNESPPVSNRIVQQTEQITKHIQGMLINARNGDLPKFVPSSRKIVMAVNDMASLFPQRPESEAVRTSLRMLVESASRLQEECSGAHRLSFVLRRDDEGRLSSEDDAKVSCLVQQVIQCASDIAKSARELVHYVTEMAA